MNVITPWFFRHLKRVKPIFGCASNGLLRFLLKKNPLPVRGVSSSLFLLLSPEFCVLFFLLRARKNHLFFDFQHLKRFKDKKSSFDETSAVNMRFLIKIDIIFFQLGTFSVVNIKSSIILLRGVAFFERQKKPIQHPKRFKRHVS